MKTRNIYIYWVGYEYKLILILRKLIYLHSTSGIGYKVILITEKNINKYIKDIPDYFNELCPAFQADFVRVNVICDYGGIWLDSDTIVIDNLDSLFDLIETKNGFFIKENNDILWNGIFGSKPNTSIMIKWKTEMIKKLNTKKGKILWAEIGNLMLKNIYDEDPSLYDNYKIFDGLDNLYPVNWDRCPSEYVDKPYDNYKNIIRDYQPLIVIVNSVYKKLENKSMQEILEGNIPLNYFINKSIENKNIYKNSIYTNQHIYNYGKTDYISNSIIQYKCWEPNISNIFENIIKNINYKSVILDIGCNIGYFSIICSNNINLSKIYSIDANINNINILDISCYLNGINNIQTINVCISDKSGEIYEPGNKEFVTKVGNIGGLNYIKIKDNLNIDNLTKETIISITIDNLIKINNINDIIIMKVDIEGNELNSLKGALDTLKTNIIKNIIIEISPKFNNDSIEILQILKNNNYNLFNIPHYECGPYNNVNIINNICDNPIIDIYNFVKNIGFQTNILAIKDECIINNNTSDIPITNILAIKDECIINNNTSDIPITNILAIKDECIKKYVIYTDWISTYLTKEAFTFVKNLESFGWENIALSKINIENIKKIKCIILCVTYDCFDISLIKCDNIKLIYKIDDVYPYKEIRNKCIENADIIISPYQYLFDTYEIKKMYKNINLLKTFHIPYSAVNDFFKNIEFNNNPINKIFVSGAVSDFYPLRKYIKNDIKFKEYIDTLEHPSYGNYTHTCINDIYYKKMNEYICCFTDTLQYNYVLLKVFEICSIGSLLLVEDTLSVELSKLGFYDNINCIYCNKDNLQDKIKWILDIENRVLVDNMRKLGMLLVRNEHTTKNRSDQFINIIDKIY